MARPSDGDAEENDRECGNGGSDHSQAVVRCDHATDYTVGWPARFLSGWNVLAQM
jgi:hypothetical protein